MSDPILIAGLAFLAGVIITAAILKTRSETTTRQRRVESQLEQLRTEYTHYQAEVAEHFTRTAELLGKLNANYREIFNHLANGADRLSNDPDFKRIASNAPSPVDLSQITDTELDEDDGMAPPLDYAPKKAPDERGTLSEGFGLTPPEEDDAKHTPSSPMAAPAEPAAPDHRPTV